MCGKPRVEVDCKEADQLPPLILRDCIGCKEPFDLYITRDFFRLTVLLLFAVRSFLSCESCADEWIQIIESCLQSQLQM